MRRNVGEARFIRIARGSLEETKDHLDAALERSYISDLDHAELITLANRARPRVRVLLQLDWPREAEKLQDRRLHFLGHAARIAYVDEAGWR